MNEPIVIKINIYLNDVKLFFEFKIIIGKPIKVTSIKEYKPLFLLLIASKPNIIENKKNLFINFGNSILRRPLKFIEKIAKEKSNNAINSKPNKTTSTFIETPITANSGVAKKAAEPKREINLEADKNLQILQNAKALNKIPVERINLGNKVFSVTQ